MKKLFTILATIFISLGLHAQSCGPGTGAAVCSYGPISGTTGVDISLPSNGGLVPAFDYECSSGSCTVTLKACTGAQCILLDSYSGGSTVRTPDQFTVKSPSGTYQYFIVNATFGSGTFTVLEANNNTASNKTPPSSGPGSGTVTQVGATLPIVVTPNPITGAGTVSCPTCQTVAPPTIATTPNVLKGDNAGNGIASSIVDNGTTPTQTPNGLTTATKGLSQNLGNDNPGTVTNDPVCVHSNGKAYDCATTDTSLIAGVAVTGAGNSGNVTYCITQCDANFDNATTVNDIAIKSTTTTGFHDTGGTSLVPGVDNFIVNKTIGGSGVSNIDILTPRNFSASNGGGGNTGGKTTIEINGTLTKPIANINSTTPAAQANNINATVQSSTSGNTTSASVEIPITGNAAKAVSATSLPGIAGAAVCDDGSGNIKDSGCSGGGLTNVVMPSDIFASSITSNVETVTKNNGTAGYVVSVPSSTQGSVSLVSTTKCTFSQNANIAFVCTLNQSSQSGQFIRVITFDNLSTNCSTIAFTFTDNQSNSYSKSGCTASNTTNTEYYLANSPSGITSVTGTISGSSSSVQVVMFVEQYTGIATSSPLDGTTVGTGFSGCGTGVYTTNTITTTNANDVIFASLSGPNNQTIANIAPSLLAANQSFTSGSSVSGGDEYRIVNAVNTYSSQLSCSTNVYSSLLTAFKLASPSGSQPYGINPLSFTALQVGPFPGLIGSTPSISSSDTQIDLHVGNHIVSNGRSTAYAGSGGSSDPSFLFTTATGQSSGYTVHVYVKCNTAVATDTVTPAVVFTSDDGSSTVETLSGSAALCTTLGTGDLTSFITDIHAKANTSIYIKTTLGVGGGGISYNTDAYLTLHSTQ